MAASARPSAISRAAVPMASMDEAQAVHTVICGPCRSYFMAICAAAMFGQILIIVLRGTLWVPVSREVLGLGGGRGAAHAGAVDDRRPPRIQRPDPGIVDRLGSGGEGEPGEAVGSVEELVVDPVPSPEPFDGGTERRWRPGTERQLGDLDPEVTVQQSPAVVVDVQAQRGDDPEPGDRHVVHAASSSASRAAPGLRAERAHKNPEPNPLAGRDGEHIPAAESTDHRARGNDMALRLSTGSKVAAAGGRGGGDPGRRLHHRERDDHALLPRTARRPRGRFLSEGHPQDGRGSSRSYGEPGIEPLSYPGLLKRVIGGWYTPHERLRQMILDDEVEAYLFPSAA
jgi:hypothetical protein